MRPSTPKPGLRVSRRTAQFLCALLLVCVSPNISLGYSVLTHEAIIDSMWVHDIVPVLLKKFPGASEDELREAHGYAYGGAIIQDMGYYPFGSTFYSELTHYVRSGEFVEALLRDAEDIKEYAFAVGALSHYWADNGGHTIATNMSVAILYPKLQRKFGDTITYEQARSAHLQTEFGFDVLQVAQGHYARASYHNFIGFKVATPLLKRAFKETYGIELSSLFTSLDLAIGTYRHTVSVLMPTLTKAAWQSTKADMAKQGVAQAGTRAKDSVTVDTTKRVPTLTREKFLFSLSRSQYNQEWGDQYQKPSVWARVWSLLFRILPKIGPLRGFAIHPSTPATELLFMRAFDSTTTAYRRSLVKLAANTLVLDDRNLATGRPTRAGEYRMADATYARMLQRLAGKKFEDVLPALQSSILAFYRDTTMRSGTKKDSVAWRSTLANLAGLRAAGRVTRPAGER